MFFGSYNTVVDNGEFLIPENLQSCVEASAKYDVFYYPSEWEKGLLYISFVFKNSHHYSDAPFISSGYVTKDKKIRVPEEYVEIMNGECLLIGNFEALELSKVPIEVLLGDVEDIPVLKISFD